MAAKRHKPERSYLSCVRLTFYWGKGSLGSMHSPDWRNRVNGGAKLVHPGGAKLVRLTLCGTRCWGVVPVVHRRDPRCFV